MALSPEIRKLLQQALRIRGSAVPLHRIIDILAMEDGDVSQAVNRFRDIKNQDLRRALHNCALLLRELEREAGMTPAWEAGAKATSLAAQTGNAGSPPPRAAAAPKPAKPRFTPGELIPFEDENYRGKVRMAKAYVDGASKGNPGEAGIGVAMFTMDGIKIAQTARAIGTATNNIAEYTALIEALNLAKRMGIAHLFVLSDSELMVRQMTGVYKIKNLEILRKVKEAKTLTRQLEKFSINHVGRENNCLADALSTSLLKKKPATTVESDPGDAMAPLDDNPDEGATE
jgi:ribonuclease HI